MENYIVSDFIILLRPNQTNSEVFNTIDNSLLFSGSDAECKAFCKTYINNNQIKLKTMEEPVTPALAQEFQLFVEPILDPTKELSEQTKFGVFIKPLSRTKAFLCYGSEDECQSYIRKVNEMYPDICKNTTEAEKVLEKYFPNPDDLVNGRVKSVIVKAMEQYASLSRKQVIEEIEEWAKFNNYGQERIIFLKDLLEYIKTLKP